MPPELISNTLRGGSHATSRDARVEVQMSKLPCPPGRSDSNQIVKPSDAMVAANVVPLFSSVATSGVPHASVSESRLETNKCGTSPGGGYGLRLPGAVKYISSSSPVSVGSS